MRSSEPTTASIFEERAENLDQHDFDRLTASTPRDGALIRKLIGPGLKLLSGPRGSGKSTLLRKAYYDALGSSEVLGAYVNFSKSLSLEPLFLQKANALQIFRQWVMFKLVLGLADGLRSSGKSVPQSLSSLELEGTSFIHDVETSQHVNLPSHLVSPSEFVSLVEQWLVQSGAARCVLLLDDAAHAFSPEQQREFFEIFRSLRSRRISAKAAVYPGITSYTPFFHVGHEAELLEVWHSPEDDDYLSTMREVARTRLTPDMYESFGHNVDLIDYLALASFGLPRGFLNMLSYVLGIDEDSDIYKPTRARADKAIRLQAESVEGIFSSLKGKLPRYEAFIEIGAKVELSIAALLKDFNVRKEPGRAKAYTVGIAQPFSNELKTILEMAQYAGILREERTVSRGEKGVFQLFTLHFAILLRENSLSLGKSPSVRDAVASLSSSNAHAFVRTRESSLLSVSDRAGCKLNLAPCKSCGAKRASEEAKFCMNCGATLTNNSIYKDLVSCSIQVLPLTENKIKGLLRHTSIKTVQDILMDDAKNEIRTVPYVGEVWTSRIMNAASEYVSV